MLVYVLVFIFGLMVGSFLNVVIWRYNTGWSVVKGRSQCLACGHELRWFELVPLISFVLQAGRCRQCGAKLSWQYPVVEVLTGLLFLKIVLVFGSQTFNPAIIFWWLIVSILLVITVYDLRHKIIPDGLVGWLLILALVRWVVLPSLPITNYLLAAAGLFAFFALLWSLSHGRWMGFGDAKLALVIGLLLGVEGGVSAVVLAFWSGAAVGLLLIAGQRLSLPGRSFTIKSEIPFAPFLALGTILYFLFDFNVFTFF